MSNSFLLAMVIRLFENVALLMKGENCMYSHHCTGDATSLYFVTKIQHVEFLVIF